MSNVEKTREKIKERAWELIRQFNELADEIERKEARNEPITGNDILGWTVRYVKLLEELRTFEDLNLEELLDPVTRGSLLGVRMRVRDFSLILKISRALEVRRDED